MRSNVTIVLSPLTTTTILSLIPCSLIVVCFRTQISYRKECAALADLKSPWASQLIDTYHLL